MCRSSNRNVEGRQFLLYLIVKVLVFLILADKQRNCTSLYTHSSTQIGTTGCVGIGNTLLLTNSGQVAHDVHGRHIAGKDANAAWAIEG